MPTYIYKARDTTGKPVKGDMEAATKDELIGKLHNMGYMVTNVTEALPMVKVDSVFDKLRMVGSEDLIMFDIQLSNMINAGITVLASLSTLTKQVENKRLRKAVEDIAASVESGDSFSQALARHPRIFPPLFISMVRAGEASGQLDTILTRYASYSENQEDLKQKVRGALFYPVILLAAGLFVILFVITSIIPQFAKIFVEAGVPLPLPTLLLYKTGTTIRNFWHLVAFLVVIGWLGAVYYARTGKGRLNVDKLKLKLPVMGVLVRKTCIARFARTLGILVSSGVPILQALDIVKDIAGNEVLGRVVGNARVAVERGERIAGPLKISGEFPPDTVQMIAVGEETGNLDGMLNKISDFYERSIGYAIKKLTTLIEPIFLIIMGGMIGFIMASLILPIFDMLKVLRS